MNVEEEIKNCEIYLKQIKQYDPEPHYVDYFLNNYIISINRITNEIFGEANRDFGLFISGNISEQKFYEKAKLKNDESAIKFSEWYLLKYNEKHKNPYPDFMRKIIQFKNEFKKLPEIKIMIRASNRYKDDINQQIKIDLSHKKLRLKEELDIEIKRQTQIFLEIINDKRNKKDEPNVGRNQIVASACLGIEKYQNIEISYASEIYMSVIRQLVDESRKKIKELTR